MGKEAKLKPMTESERSVFGAAWEASRRGASFAENPHDPGHPWKYQMWSEGWLRYRDSLIGTCEQGPAKLEAKRKRK